MDGQHKYTREEELQLAQTVDLPYGMKGTVTALSVEDALDAADAEHPTDKQALAYLYDLRVTLITATLDDIKATYQFLARHYVLKGIADWRIAIDK